MSLADKETNSEIVGDVADVGWLLVKWFVDGIMNQRVGKRR